MPDATHIDESAQKKNWIYAIGVDTSPVGPVKIGRTTQDVARRLSLIRSDPALIVPDNLDRGALKVLYAAEAEPWVERRLHLHFGRYHVCGEWFALNPAVVAREVKMAIAEIQREAERLRRDIDEREAAAIQAEVQADPIAEPLQIMSAARQWELFNGWVGAGFSEQQALRMVTMLVPSPTT